MKQSGEIPWRSELSSIERIYDHIVHDDLYQKEEYIANMTNGEQLAVNKWISSHLAPPTFPVPTTEAV